jgi:hypothetical protein
MTGTKTVSADPSLLVSEANTTAPVSLIGSAAITTAVLSESIPQSPSLPVSDDLIQTANSGAVSVAPVVEHSMVVTLTVVSIQEPLPRKLINDMPLAASVLNTAIRTVDAHLIGSSLATATASPRASADELIDVIHENFNNPWTNQNIHPITLSTALATTRKLAMQPMMKNEATDSIDAELLITKHCRNQKITVSKKAVDALLAEFF